MLVLGVVTQSLWSPLQDRELFPYVAYGLPSLEAGRLWTPVTGPFFALVPAQYLPVAGGALVIFGWSEWRLGTRRVAIAAIAAQLFGVLGTSLFLFVFRGTGWAWAQQLSETLDVGFSAGALGAVAAASATLIPPWRGRVRFVLCLYVSISLLYIGLLWDVEHFLAVMLGLALGPFLLGRKPRFSPARFTRHEWRVIAATFFIVSAVINIVVYLVPSDGPLGATGDDSDATSVLINAVISLAVARGLSRGLAARWRDRRHPHVAGRPGGWPPPDPGDHCRGPAQRPGRTHLGHATAARHHRPQHRPARCAHRRPLRLPRRAAPGPAARADGRGERSRRRHHAAQDARWHDDVVDGHLAGQPLVPPP